MDKVLKLDIDGKLNRTPYFTKSFLGKKGDTLTGEDIYEYVNPNWDYNRDHRAIYESLGFGGLKMKDQVVAFRGDSVNTKQDMLNKTALDNLSKLVPENKEALDSWAKQFIDDKDIVKFANRKFEEHKYKMASKMLDQVP